MSVVDQESTLSGLLYVESAAFFAMGEIGPWCCLSLKLPPNERFL
jgi:hypothetical protein